MEAYRIDRFGSVDGIGLRSSEDPQPVDSVPRKRSWLKRRFANALSPVLPRPFQSRSIRLSAGVVGYPA